MSTVLAGFQDGYIYWDDEDFGNKNSHDGVLPDGEFGTNTKIYYCCRYILYEFLSITDIHQNCTHLP